MKRLLVFALFLGGCGGAAAPEPRVYDLGLQAPGAPLPPVRIGHVRSVAPFDGPDMVYRLAYRSNAEIGVFANTRWAASPGEMMRKQLLRAAGDSGKCTLEVEVQEFTQVFGAKEASDVRIEVRAWLGVEGKRARTRGFNVIEQNAGPDAVSGAAAFTRAADRAIGELGRWIASQPDCH